MMLQPEEDESSDESDEDYVPQGEEVDVSEEEESGEDEDPIKVDQNTAKTDRKRRRANSRKSRVSSGVGARKRAGGIRLEDQEVIAVADEEQRDLAAAIESEKKQVIEESEKKRVDDLWSDFMKDVGQSNKPSRSSSSNSKQVSTATPSGHHNIDKKPAKVTIKKIFDFAGEVVEVNEEVDAESKAAKNVSSVTISPGPSSISSGSCPPAAAAGTKRVGSGLGGVLGMISKKQKISTLDKSKLDWNNFKQKEGIEEELKIHNRGKNGYIERKNFLERSDLRQFEIEKTIRQMSGKR